MWVEAAGGGKLVIVLINEFQYLFFKKLSQPE